MRPLRVAAAVLTLALLALAGTLTGKFETATGGPVAHGTLTLTLSQAAVVPGSYAVVPSAVSCYTTATGAVVGLPDPTVAPSLTADPGLGTLASGTYFVETTIYTAAGESAPTPEASVLLTANGSIEVQAPALPAGGSYGVYIRTSSGAETRQGIEASGTPYVQSVPLVAGVTPPAANTSQCVLEFNDSMVPAPTFYIASLTDASGSVLPGYPQDWFLAGSSADVSSIQPLSTPPGLSFADPLVLNPQTTAAQSINSPIQLNGFSVEGAANVGPTLVSFFWSGALPAPSPSATVAEWTPHAAVVVRQLSILAQTPGAGGSSGTAFGLYQNGTEICGTAGTLLSGAAAYVSTTAFTAPCDLAPGVPAVLAVSSDDHSTRPSNVQITLEMTAQ